ncbi:MAG: tRNA (N6-isopentenyl adenosine(37)-C2)-methylthiotransferase MiaB [Myxococcota bacterium]
MSRQVYIETYGCQMNELDSELVQGQLEALGYGFTAKADEADVVLLNTCSVREHSEHKVWSYLGRLGQAKREQGREVVVGVLGCMAEREAGNIFTRMPHVDLVCGPSMLDKLPSLLDNVVQSKSRQSALTGHTARRSATLDAAMDGIEAMDLSRAFSPYANDRESGIQKRQAYVRITRGCNKFCSFCVVPYTRGPEVHRPAQHIIDEVKRLVDAGVLEVTLIGQTINHYHHEGTSFAQLLYRVHEEVPDLARLRFLTSYPRDFTDEALDVMAACDRIAKYLHVPAQSGSDRMLKLMNRGYTVGEYMDLLDRARARMPSVRLAGDMIVGFPTETDEDHLMSLQLLERARYKSCYAFKYSPRPGTVSSRRYEDDVPDEVKRARNQSMLEVLTSTSIANNQSRVGQVLDVIVESETRLRRESAPIDGVVVGWAKKESVRLIGRTDGDEIVAFDGPRSLLGSMTKVRALSATAVTILGEHVGQRQQKAHHGATPPQVEGP